MKWVRNAWNWLHNQYLRLPNSIRAAWNTSWITFVTVMITTLTGVLGTLVDAAGSGDYEEFFDQLSLAGSSIVAGVSALLIGILNAVYRAIVPVERSYVWPPPPPPTD